MGKYRQKRQTLGDLPWQCFPEGAISQVSDDFDWFESYSLTRRAARQFPIKFEMKVCAPLWGNCMSSESLVITILNWKKYQPQAEKFENSNWFRLENRLFEHAIWEDLNAREFKFFIFLLMLVSKNGHKSGTISVSTVSMRRQSGARSDTVVATLDRLRAHGILEYQILKMPPRGAQAALHYITEHNNTEQGKSIFDSGEKNQTKRSVPMSVLQDLRRIQGRPMTEESENE